MLCLKCTRDNTHRGPNCMECGNYIGFIADGRGFIPQLEYLDKDMQEQNITPEECGERLQRLEIALASMIQHFEKAGESVVNLGLDEMQQGTMAGFMAPARQGLEEMMKLVATIDPAEEWPPTIFPDFEAAQFKILRGSEGMSFLTNVLFDMSREKGINLEEIAKQEGLIPENEPAEKAEA